MNENSYRAPARGPTLIGLSLPEFIGYTGRGRHGIDLY
jgi:hypothetical protein